MKNQISKVALMATLAFIGVGFAGTQQAKAGKCVEECNQYNVDSCGLAPFSTTITQPYWSTKPGQAFDEVSFGLYKRNTRLVLLSGPGNSGSRPDCLDCTPTKVSGQCVRDGVTLTWQKLEFRASDSAPYNRHANTSIAFMGGASLTAAELAKPITNSTPDPCEKKSWKYGAGNCTTKNKTYGG